MGIYGKLSVNEIDTILLMCQHPRIDMFVETGTYIGESTCEAAKMFSKVITIDVVDELQSQAKELAKKENLNNIEFLLGKSQELLPDICDTHATLNCMWFLDAHHSGPETGCSGDKVPLLQELETILTRWKGEQGIFIFDDLRLFDKYWDWKQISIETIKQTFQKHKREIELEWTDNDRYMVYISSL